MLNGVKHLFYHLHSLLINRSFVPLDDIKKPLFLLRDEERSGKHSKAKVNLLFDKQGSLLHTRTRREKHIHTYR